MADFADILTMPLVTRVVSTVAAPGDVLSRHFNMEIGNSKVERLELPGLTYTYDLFDHRRTAAAVSGPYDSAGTTAANPVGNNTVGLVRSAEKIPLTYAKLSRMRELGSFGKLDVKGKAYLAAQAAGLRELQNNLREVIVSGCVLRGGKVGVIKQGQKMRATFASSGTYFNIDMKIPGDNISDSPSAGTFADALANQPLTMGQGSNAPGQPSIIDAPWSAPTTNIPVQLTNVSNGFQRKVGMPLRRIYCDPSMFLNVLANNYVRQLAGTANMSFASYDSVPLKDGDGNDTDFAKITIKGLPFYEFYCYNGVLSVPDVNGVESLQQLVPANHATFTVEPSTNWLRGIEGAEYVKEQNWTEVELKSGFAAWVMERADPAAIELHTLQIFGVEINRPGGIAYAQVS